MAAPSPRFEVAVVGAGAAGLAAALALAREGVSTALIGAHAPVADGRTVALLDGSVRFLAALDVWAGIAPHAAPLAELHIVDDTGSLFRPPPARFVAAEIGLDAFGWNVESARLVESLRQQARATPGLTVFEHDATGFEPGAVAAAVTLEDGARVEARLVVGADGGRSKLRAASGLEVREWSYPQSAITTLLAHDRPHRDVSTEFHTRQGPFTLVPLPGGHRSSLVWVTGAMAAARLAELDDVALA
ncbi:MAG TPA: FAD-dependent monooxygenase, partial [Methylobacterium sp.]